MSDEFNEEAAQYNLIMRAATCAALCVCAAIAGCTVYSVRSSDNDLRQKQLDQGQMLACVKTGGSWVPIKLATISDGTQADTNMACVRGPVDPKALSVRPPETK